MLINCIHDLFDCGWSLCGESHDKHVVKNGGLTTKCLKFGESK